MSRQPHWTAALRRISAAAPPGGDPVRGRLPSGSAVRDRGSWSPRVAAMRGHSRLIPALRLAGVTGPGGVAAGRLVVIGRLRRGRRQRCKWRAGRGWSGRSRISWSCGDRRERRLPARPEAELRHPTAAVMNAWRRVWGPTGLMIPARRATRRTIRPAPWRSSLLPSAATKMGPSVRSPMARAARALPGGQPVVRSVVTEE
jgi:hypothetical protein